MLGVINLGKHTINVSVSNGFRMVKHSDVKELLNLSNKGLTDYFIDSKIIVDTLYEKIYINKTATKEQEIIFKGLCIVGLNSLIDEACKIDLRGVSYIKEFNQMISNN